MATGSSYVLAMLLNAAWQIPLILAAAMACSWLLRRTPARQHVVCLAALALCFVAPLASLRPYRGAETAPATERPGPLRIRLSAYLPVPVDAASLGGRVLLGVYLVSVLWAAGRLGLSWRRSRAAVGAARELDPMPEFSAASALCRTRLGSEPPRLLRSPAVAAPFTFGIARPVIVLPHAFCEAASSDAIIATLGHETAHVRRRDFLWNAIVECVFPLVAFHPAAHRLRRLIRSAREFACDDLVAANLLDGSRYAASLLDVALRSAAAPELSPSVGATGEGDLESRVRRLVLPAAARPAAPALRAALSVGLFLAVALASTAFGFQVTDPRDFSGVWHENWAAGHMTIPVDEACCYRTLEIVYGNGALSAAMTTEMADTVNGRLVKAAPRRRELLEPRLVNGILEFHQKVGGRDQIVEVTLDQEGRALVRSHMVQPDHNWTPMPRLR